MSVDTLLVSCPCVGREEIDSPGSRAGPGVRGFEEGEVGGPGGDVGFDVEGAGLSAVMDEGGGWRSARMMRQGDEGRDRRCSVRERPMPELAPVMRAVLVAMFEGALGIWILNVSVFWLLMCDKFSHRNPLGVCESEANQKGLTQE